MSSAGSFADWLAGSLSHDRAVLEHSTHQLENAFRQDFAAFITAMIKEHVNASALAPIRIAAGLALKNVFSIKDPVRQREHAERWLLLDSALRQGIKEAVIENLGQDSGTQSAQVISAIAGIEIPRNCWPELIEKLLLKVADPQSSEILVVNSLKTIGYICEAIEPNHLASQSDTILTAVVSGASAQSTPRVRKCALQALSNCITFAKKNFERQSECNMIMQVLCECASLPVPDDSCETADINVSAFECICKIIDTYYYLLEPYMEALRFISMNLVLCPHEQVSLQAIEFWSTLCEKEDELLQIEWGAAELNASAPVKCKNYVDAFANSLFPVLFEVMCKQREDVDDDEWYPAMAASLCVQFLANLVGRKIFEVALYFIDANLLDPSWNKRDAAIMAFGSILESDDADALEVPAKKVLDVIIVQMNAPESVVRDSAAWAIGRICERFAATMPEITQQNLVQALLKGLMDESQIATTCCWALSNFAEQCDISSKDHDDATGATSRMFQVVSSSLLTVAMSPDANVERGLRMSALQTLARWVLTSAKDCDVHSQQIAASVMQFVEATNQRGASLAELELDLLGPYYAVLNAAITKLKNVVRASPESIVGHMRSTLSIQNLPSLVREEVICCIGTLASALDGGCELATFEALMAVFYPYLSAAILESGKDEPSLCKVGIGALTDIMRALGNATTAAASISGNLQTPNAPGNFATIQAHVDSVMNLLKNVLSDAGVDIWVKPRILSSIGDIVLAAGPSVIQGGHLRIIMEIMNHAAIAAESSTSSAAGGNSGHVPEVAANGAAKDGDSGGVGHTVISEYGEALREAVVEAMSCVVNCYSASDRMAELVPYVEFILSVIYRATTDVQGILLSGSANSHPDRLFTDAAGILGDLAQSLGTTVSLVLRQAWVETFFHHASNSSPDVRTTVEWARSQIAALPAVAMPANSGAAASK